MDAIYMDAVQAMTGRGGWPLNAFLTPAGAAVLRRHVLASRAAPRPAGVVAGRHRGGHGVGGAAGGDRGGGPADPPAARRRGVDGAGRGRPRPGGARRRRRAIFLHVERRRRLVGDEELGTARERHRDHRPLPLAARELVRIGVDALAGIGDARAMQQLDRATRAPRSWRVPRGPRAPRRSGCRSCTAG